MPSQKPTIGRIVHWTTHGDALGKYPSMICAAIVTRVPQTDPLPDGAASTVGPLAADLTIFNPDGWFIRKNCEFTEHPAGTPEARGKWSWPARE